VKAARSVPLLLAAATLILLGANALPTANRKHRLQDERNRLILELRHEEERMKSLAAEVRALREDPFYVERLLVETWQGVPEGAVAFDLPPDDPDDPIQD
jgi:hypothetical protein